jgi:hypothetical protein
MIGESTAPPAPLPANSSKAILASNANAAPHLAASEVGPVPPGGFPACGNGDLKIRFADLDDALQPDTKALPAYVDSGISFYRIEKSDAAFPDIAGVKRIEKESRSKPVPVMTRKRPFVATAIATSVTLVSQRRMTVQGPSGGEAGASAVRLR